MKSYEDRIKADKDEASKALKETVVREQAEKAGIQEKYDKKRKEFKDLQAKM
jgi:hypothetical protein